MWHEARRQERKIRGMLVDYRKRAERRRDFYEKIKADPTQFLQVHGRQCKIHLDPAIAAAADSTAMMPWQGNDSNLIDRFDVRAHLDYIPPSKNEDEPELSQEDRQLNYERYRIIAQNAYLGISEEKFLKQLHLEEQFGYTEVKTKKESKTTGAAIGFNYEDGTAISAPPPAESPEENFDDENSDSDLDVDLAINVSKVDSAQAHEMNKQGQHFGMFGNDFYSFLTDDLEEAESFKLAKEEEHEKALYAGRKSRRERRAHREKRLANRKISPPSYAAKESPTNISLRDDSKSPSRSPSPDAGKITYITSFGGEEDPPSTSKPSYADKVKYGKAKTGNGGSNRSVYFDKRKRSTSREVSYGRGRKFNCRSRSRSRSRRERRDHSKSRSPRNKRGLTRSRSKSSRTLRHSNSRSVSPIVRKESRSSSSGSRSRSKPIRSRSRSSGSTRSPKRKTSYGRQSSSRSPSSDENPPGVSKSKSKSPVLSGFSKSKSKSPEAPAPPRIRYYGRKKSDESSSESSSSSDENDRYNRNAGTSESGNRFGNNSGTMSKKSTTGLTVIERLKLKRQALINRQFKKDKIAEVQKIMREKEAQQTREDELREMAIKLRRRQRELRHAYDRSSSSDSERSDVSKKTRELSTSPTRSRELESTRDKDRGRRRSSSRERSRRDGRRNRSQERDINRRRTRSRSRRRYDRSRERDGRRSRSSPEKGCIKKLVDY